jgi:deoxyribodipyrimidine photo-lyase
MSAANIDSEVPALRLRCENSVEVRPDGEFVLYWMTTNRRCHWNFGLQRAVDWARALRKPLVVLEALRIGYEWASDRLHYFIIQGMADNSRQLAGKRACYFPYVEPAEGAGKGLLAELGRRACIVIGDDYPCFFLPRMMASAARQIPVRLEFVDSNGLLPMRAADKCFCRAFDFRRFLQRELREHLVEFPRDDPLKNARLPVLKHLPGSITQKWPPADVDALARDPSCLARLPIDHSVAIVPIAGGARAAERRLASFLANRLRDYDVERNHPDADATSGLSPDLHFGQLSVHEVFVGVMSGEQWSPRNCADEVTGSAQGWWGVSAAAEAFLDQLLTWRELGFNMCCYRRDYDRYESLPAWARRTLADHQDDPREYQYSLAEFAQAETHDPLWNAAQRQLSVEGRIHNYLRMLWGKKILEWSASAQEALAVMIELNNRFALDGRDPNSYSGIFWVLGRYDRAWGPERPIYGKIRYMSSDNARRKLHVNRYLKEFGPQG